MSKENNVKEEYTPDWDFVSGSLDSTMRMLAVPKSKYKEVTINLTEQVRQEGDKTIHGFNYGIAQIDLHNGTHNSQSKVFDDATKLAEQIAKRWNEHPILQAEVQQLKEQLRWRSFTNDVLPIIGMTIISKRKDQAEYDITFLKNHDVIHYLCETSTHWLPIPRKEET